MPVSSFSPVADVFAQSARPPTCIAISRGCPTRVVGAAVGNPRRACSRCARRPSGFDSRGEVDRRNARNLYKPFLFTGIALLSTSWAFARVLGLCHALLRVEGIPGMQDKSTEDLHEPSWEMGSLSSDHQARKYRGIFAFVRLAVESMVTVASRHFRIARVSCVAS